MHRSGVVRHRLYASLGCIRQPWPQNAVACKRADTMVNTIQTVHTSGVNWDSVAVIVSSCVAVLGFIFALVAKWVSGMIVRAIDTFRIEMITAINSLDKRIGTLETRAEGDIRRLRDDQ